MRVAFIGASHWHAPLYFVPAAHSAGIEIVGVSDPNPEIVKSVARDLGAKGFTDHRELLAAVKPEFAFAFAPHRDMPDVAHALIDEKVPFIIEKPGGLNSKDVAAFRDRAKEKGVYAGTGFNFRVSDLFKRIEALVADNPVTHCSFRYIAGGPYRYRQSNSDWMMDPERAGGGSTINLSLHFIDMFRQFSRSHPTEVASLLGNYTWNLPIEDYSSMIIRSPRCVGTIETGMTFPVSRHGVFDLRFSIRTTRHYLIARNDNVLEVRRASDGYLEEHRTETSNFYMYPDFVTDAVDRFARGHPPLASLDDLVGVMQVVDAAFESNRKAGASVKVAT
jgi:predicted dehydrogenase